MIICVFGLPGSGKSYQSQLLSKDVKCIHLIASDILRKELQKKEIDIMDEGGLIDDQRVRSVIFEKIGDSDIVKDKVVVLDGYPRTIEQLRSMQDEYPDSIFMLLDVPNDVCEKRISKRKSQRLDDSSEIMKKRIQVQKNEISKMEVSWKNIVKIDGVGEKKVVQERIKSYLKNMNLI